MGNQQTATASPVSRPVDAHTARLNQKSKMNRGAYEARPRGRAEEVLEDSLSKKCYDVIFAPNSKNRVAGAKTWEGLRASGHARGKAI